VDGRDLEIYKMLLFMVRSLVDRPDDVEIDSVPNQDGSMLWIRTHPMDVARLIGKNGQTARALQIIVGASAMKLGRRFNMDIARGTLPM
jgi:predicted RNA-binding protein YlqC (UPF0109 family)